jgi:hypothetical protein
MEDCMRALTSVCLLAFVAGCGAETPKYSAASAPFRCGEAQTITVALQETSTCVGAQGWLSWNTDELTINSATPVEGLCLFFDNEFEQAAERWPVLRWAFLCNATIEEPAFPIYTLSVTPTTSTMLHSYVEIATDSGQDSDGNYTEIPDDCGAFIEPIEITCTL